MMYLGHLVGSRKRAFKIEKNARISAIMYSNALFEDLNIISESDTDDGQIIRYDGVIV